MALVRSMEEVGADENGLKPISGNQLMKLRELLADEDVVIIPIVNKSKKNLEVLVRLGLTF